MTSTGQSPGSFFELADSLLLDLATGALLDIGSVAHFVDERDGRVCVSAETETVRLEIAPRSIAAARP